MKSTNFQRKFVRLNLTLLNNFAFSEVKIWRNQILFNRVLGFTTARQKLAGKTGIDSFYFALVTLL